MVIIHVNSISRDGGECSDESCLVLALAGMVDNSSSDRFLGLVANARQSNNCLELKGGRITEFAVGCHAEQKELRVIKGKCGRCEGKEFHLVISRTNES